MPRTPAPRTYRTEMEIPVTPDANFIETIREVANPKLVIEFEGMDLWEIREACEELESKLDIRIAKPVPVQSNGRRPVFPRP